MNAVSFAFKRSTRSSTKKSKYLTEMAYRIILLALIKIPFFIFHTLIKRLKSGLSVKQFQLGHIDIKPRFRFALQNVRGRNFKTIRSLLFF